MPLAIYLVSFSSVSEKEGAARRGESEKKREEENSGGRECGDHRCLASNIPKTRVDSLARATDQSRPEGSTTTEMAVW